MNPLGASIFVFGQIFAGMVWGRFNLEPVSNNERDVKGGLMKNWVLSLFIALGVTSAAHAEQDSETTSSGESRVELKSVKPRTEEKSDGQITNARLAADAGSDSPVSFRAILSYSGGSVEKPFDRVRPNYRRLGGNPIADTSVGGSIGGAIRLDSQSQLRFSTGISMRTPFHNSVNELTVNKNAETGNRVFNVSGVTTEYNRTFRKGNVMYAPSFSATVATDQFETQTVGRLGSASASLGLTFDFEGSRWQPGVSLLMTQYVYGDGNQFDTRNRRRENLGGGAYPFVEYKFNNTYAFRALFGFFNYTNYRDQNLGQFYRDGHYVSTGLGISPRRHIWIYPNVQFAPNDIRGDLTNVGLSTIINL